MLSFSHLSFDEMKHLWILFLILLCILNVACRAQRGKSPVLGFNQVKTNVIVIITDDQGYGDIAAHGNPDIKTPGLDALHAESVRLTDFHVDPTCSPTRAALQTGRYSSRVGVWLTYGGRNHLRKDEVSLGDAFKESGYKTATFGKWHLGDNYPFRPQDRGYDHSLIHGGGVVGETPDYWNNDYYDDIYFRNGEPEQVEGYCTDVWFREASDWIEENKEQPFFVYLATNAPHGPSHVPMEYVQPYLDAGIPKARAIFYGMIQVIDENIIRLRQRLEDLEIAEDTMIVFMTDNGTTRGYEPGENPEYPKSGYNAGMRGKKSSVYEGGHRAAGFIHWPKGNLVHGADVPQLTAHVDIMPTLVELCNLKLPKRVRFDGTDISLLLRGKPNSWSDRTLFVHHQGRFGQFVGDGFLIKDKDYAVMTQQWRMVGDELYEIASDPGQRTDVAAENPKVVKKLREEYEDWWEDIYPGSEAYVPFVVDTAKQEMYTLSSQNWHGDTIPYSQRMVRTGMEGNGFWAVDIVESGSYEISVRRWPVEADAAMNAAVELGPYDPSRHSINARTKEPTKVMEVRSVRLKAADYDQTLAVTPGDKEVRFNVYLPEGEHKIQAWLNLESGDLNGAYYVYLRKS